MPASGFQFPATGFGFRSPVADRRFPVSCIQPLSPVSCSGFSVLFPIFRSVSGQVPTFLILSPHPFPGDPMAPTFNRPALCRNLIVPPRAPDISSKFLIAHADRLLEPTIQRVWLNGPEKGLVVKGVFEGVPERFFLHCPHSFKAKPGQTYMVTGGECEIVFVGLGKKESFDLECAKKFGARAVRLAEQYRHAELSIHVPEEAAPAIASLVENMVLGAVLSAYRFEDKLGGEEEERPVPLRSLSIRAFGDSLNKALERGLARAGCQNTARYLSDMRANELRPDTYPVLLELIAHRYGLGFLRLAPEELAAMGLNGISVVGQASPYPGSMVLLGTSVDASCPLPVLVGKGVTMDTGGMDIKTEGHMDRMHLDMEGSAAVAMAVAAASTLHPGMPLLGILSIAENRIAPNAYVVGDIIRIGRRTVEVRNTDAEGRLVLADGITVAGMVGAQQIITEATLTGAACLALGEGMEAAAFSTDADLASKLDQASKASGERLVWFPIDDSAIAKSIQGAHADLINVSSWGRPAGHRTAARFLHEFSFGGAGGKEERIPFAHLDVAPVMLSSGAWADDPRYRGPQFATGFGVNLLASALPHLHAMPGK